MNTTSIHKIAAALNAAHDALESMSDSDIDHFESDEDELEGAPAQFAARKIAEALQELGVWPAADMPAPSPALHYPSTLTPELQEVLGMPNFRCAPMAHAFRVAGLADIPHKAEAEQAFVIDKLLRHVIAHGPEWRKHANAELDQMLGSLRTNKQGEA